MSNLKVRMSGFPDLGEPPIEIRDHKLRLIKQTHAGYSVKLDPGVYVISARLPNGTLAVNSIEIGEESREIVLADNQDGPTIEAGDLDEALLDLMLPTSSLAPPFDERDWHLPSDAAEGQWYARALRPDGTPDHAARLDAAAEVQAECGYSVDLLVTLGSHDEVTFLHVGARELVPRIAALPALAPNRSRCKVRVAVGPGGIQVAAGTADAGIGTLLAAYLTQGAVRDAAGIAEHAESALFYKRYDPIAAALGGYALLRLAEPGRLHDWPQNLARWFPTMADGPIIAGMQATLQGKESAAAHWFDVALERHLPIFSSGLALLVAHVRERRLTHDVELSSRDEARLLATGPLVDYEHLTCTFPAADICDPAHSQHSLHEFPEESGWREFQRGQQVTGAHA